MTNLAEEKEGMGMSGKKSICMIEDGKSIWEEPGCSGRSQVAESLSAQQAAGNQLPFSLPIPDLFSQSMTID